MKLNSGYRRKIARTSDAQSQLNFLWIESLVETVLKRVPQPSVVIEPTSLSGCGHLHDGFPKIVLIDDVFSIAYLPQSLVLLQKELALLPYLLSHSCSARELSTFFASASFFLATTGEGDVMSTIVVPPLAAGRIEELSGFALNLFVLIL